MNFNFQNGQRVFINEGAENFSERLEGKRIYGVFEQEHHGLAVITDDNGKERVADFCDVYPSAIKTQQTGK